MYACLGVTCHLLFVTLSSRELKRQKQCTDTRITFSKGEVRIKSVCVKQVPLYLIIVCRMASSLLKEKQWITMRWTVIEQSQYSHMMDKVTGQGLYLHIVDEVTGQGQYYTW